MTLTRTQHAAIPGNGRTKRSLIYAGLAHPCNPQHPSATNDRTLVGGAGVSGSSPLFGSSFFVGLQDERKYVTRPRHLLHLVPIEGDVAGEGRGILQGLRVAPHGVLGHTLTDQYEASPLKAQCVVWSLSSRNSLRTSSCGK